MKKKSKWIAVVVAVIGTLHPTLGKMTDRPNILLCIADDWSWMSAGCYGDTQARTPNIDALAVKGIRFNQAYCSSPSCSPARAALLT